MAYEPQQEAKSEKKNTKNQKRSNERPFNFYGIRKTRNEKYMCVSLIRETEAGENEWINVPVNVKRVKLKDDYALLRLTLLTQDEDKDEDEPKAKAKKHIEDDEDL